MSADVAVATLVTVGDRLPHAGSGRVLSGQSVAVAAALPRSLDFLSPPGMADVTANRARDGIPSALVASPKFASVPLASRAALVAGRH